MEGKRKVMPEVFMYGLLQIKGDDNTIPYETIQEQLVAFPRKEVLDDYYEKL